MCNREQIKALFFTHLILLKYIDKTFLTAPCKTTKQDCCLFVDLFWITFGLKNIRVWLIPNKTINHVQSCLMIFYGVIRNILSRFF